MLRKKFKLSVQTFGRAPVKTERGLLFSVKIKPNSLKFSRFNIIISSKYDKRAVYRNKLKRQIFEWLRLHLNSFKPGLDVLIILSKSASSKTSPLPDFLKELEKLTTPLKK